MLQIHFQSEHHLKPIERTTFPTLQDDAPKVPTEHGFIYASLENHLLSLTLTSDNQPRAHQSCVYFFGVFVIYNSGMISGLKYSDRK